MMMEHAEVSCHCTGRVGRTLCCVLGIPYYSSQTQLLNAFLMQSDVISFFVDDYIFFKKL